MQVLARRCGIVFFRLLDKGKGFSLGSVPLFKLVRFGVALVSV